MKKTKNVCGNLLIAMFSTLLSIVQIKNKKIGVMQMSMASIFILLLMPMAVFADNVVANPTSTNVAWGSDVVVSYRLVNTSSVCNVDSSHKATVTINTPVGVTSNISSFQFASCNNDSKVAFTPTPISIGNYDYNITVGITGGKSGAVYSTTQANVTLHVSVPSLIGKASVIISFDDGWVYNSGNFGGADMAQPILKANNQSAVVFIIEEPVTGGWGAYMTPAQIQSLYADGWDVSSHSLTHGSGYCTTPDSSNCILYLVNANDSVFKSEMGDSKDWLDSNLWTRGSMFFAYPYGSYNPSCFAGCDGSESGSLIDKMKASGYYIGARSVDAYSWRYTNPVHPNFNIRGPGTLIMPTLSTDSTGTNIPYSVSDVITEVDNAIKENQNGLVILTFHQLVTGVPNGAEQFNINDFKKISDYLKLRNVSGNAQVVTLSQYFKVPNPIPIYVPNNATLQSMTIGRASMKISWADGVGNVTDVNEVLANGKQDYYITNRSINITGLFPGQSVTVIIDAVNTSWGKHTKNLVPLIVNGVMPIYTPSTPNISSIYGANWVLASWSPGDGLNKTDFYNVNIMVRSTSSWINGTTDTSINTTGLSPGQSVLVKVYALNGTVGYAIMNGTPAMIETVVPGTNAPVILSNTTDSANFTMGWIYKAGLNTDSVEININNGGTSDSRTESLVSNNTGTLVLQNLAPHVPVGFSIRGKNQTTGLYSDYVYANQTLGNNPVVLSNLSNDYRVTKGNVLTLHPKVTDLDSGDTIVFNTTKINETSIDPNTGVFYFDATNASLGMYNINITADDGHGSSITTKVSILVNGIPAPVPVVIYSGGGGGGSGGGSGGGGGGIGPSENFSNIVNYESQDGYIQVGKDTTMTFSTIQQGIYQVFLNGESQEVTVRVDNLRARQNGVTDAPGKVLLYTDVSINSERINGFSFSFRINESKITNAENVKIYRWNNGTWELLDTKVMSTSGANAYFQAKSIPARLSKFAIVELANQMSTVSVNKDRNMSAVKLEASDKNSSSNPKGTKVLPGFEIFFAIGAVSVLYAFAKRRR